MYKVVFCDLDGTLFDRTSKVSEGNLEAIKKIKEKGVYFLPCTGRTPSALHQLFAQNEEFMDNFISSNGAVVTLNNQVIHEVTLNKEYAKKMCEYILSKGLYVRFYAGPKIYGFEGTFMPDGAIGTQPNYVSKQEAWKIIDENPVYKMTVVDTHPEALTELEQELYKLLDNDIHLTYTSKTFLEIVAKGENKGKACRIFCDAIGCSTEEAIAIGDNQNDELMLEAVGMPCCVANATDPVKAIVKYVSPNSNTEDGVKEILEKFILNA